VRKGRLLTQSRTVRCADPDSYRAQERRRYPRKWSAQSPVRKGRLLNQSRRTPAMSAKVVRTVPCAEAAPPQSEPHFHFAAAFACSTGAEARLLNQSRTVRRRCPRKWSAQSPVRKRRLLTQSRTGDCADHFGHRAQERRGCRRKWSPHRPLCEAASPDSGPHGAPGMSAKVVRTVPCAEGAPPESEPHRGLCGPLCRTTLCGPLCRTPLSDPFVRTPLCGPLCRTPLSAPFGHRARGDRYS